MTMLSTTGVWKIVSENGTANADNKRVLTSEQRGALNAIYKKLQQEHNNSVQNCELKKSNPIKKFPNYLGGLIQAG